MSLGELELDCKTCTKEQKLDRGCESESKVFGRWQIGGYTFRRCPLKIIDSSYFWYIRAYNFMEKGILPRPGGWLDQSNKFIEVITFIHEKINVSKQTTN